MPAPGLIYSQWDKHGTCSGLSAEAYFETVRKSRAAVKIPAEFLDLAAEKTLAQARTEHSAAEAEHRLASAWQKRIATRPLTRVDDKNASPLARTVSPVS